MMMQNDELPAYERRPHSLQRKWLSGLHIGGHVVKRGLQLAAKALHRSDCGNGDERGDQTILDCSCRLVVAEDGQQKITHMIWLPSEYEKSVAGVDDHAGLLG